MRISSRRRTPSVHVRASEADAWSLLARSHAHHVAGVDAATRPVLRTLHGAVHRGAIYFHGSAVGEKLALVDREVVVAAEAPLVTLPSTFFDAERACPATTYYRSAHARGELRLVTDLPEKAAALEALMHLHQPEGGHRPLADPIHAKELSRLAVLVVRPTEVGARFKLGRKKPRAVMERVLEQLWIRGAARDLEALETIAAHHPEELSPPLLVGPAGTRLVVAPREEHLEGALAIVRDEYWNLEQPYAALRRAHAESDSWMVLTDPDGVAATARALSDVGKRAWIYDVGVRPDRRRQGLARFLLARLLDHPRVRSARSVLLGTRDAQPLYERLGFVEHVPRFTTMRLER